MTSAKLTWSAMAHTYSITIGVHMTLFKFNVLSSLVFEVETEGRGGGIGLV